MGGGLPGAGSWCVKGGLGRDAAIDMLPIGCPDGGRRQVGVLARKLAGPWWASVFSWRLAVIQDAVTRLLDEFEQC